MPAQFRFAIASAVLTALVATTPATAAEGSFTGASGHTAKGGATVIKSGDKLIIEFNAAFSQDDAPDMYVALGNGSRPAQGGVVGKLKSQSGAQKYSIAASPALEAASEVIIWCKKFAVPLGVAQLK